MHLWIQCGVVGMGAGASGGMVQIPTHRRSYEPNLSHKLARKDADLIAEVADDLPLARLVSERMGRAIDAGHGDEDFSAVVEAGRQ